MSASTLAAGLRLALGTFTVLPVRTTTPTREAAGAAMRLAPLVGLLLGVVAAAVLHVTRAATDEQDPLPLLAAVLAVITLVLLSRGLHLDGLADTADGLGSMRPAPDALAVMRKPDVGPFGVTALLLVLLAQVAALAHATAAGRGAEAVVVAAVTGRLAVLLSCTPATPAASTTGLGATVAGTVSRWSAFTVTAVSLVVAAGLGVAAAGGEPAAAGVRCVGAALAGLAVGHLLRAHVVRRLGGITGDVLGALVEVTTTVTLIAMAAF